jgi:predicted metal-dependent phosphoesterase TrpH
VVTPSNSRRAVRGSADLHIHTCYSDGRPTPRQVLSHVRAMGEVQVIAITDHNTIAGAERAAALAPEYGVAVIVGEEVSSTGGHILGLFLQERVPPGLSAEDTIRAIHAQAGIAVAAHPCYRPLRPQGPDGRPTMESVGPLMETLPFDAVEVVNGTPFLGPANQRAQCRNRGATRRAEVGASDAHILPAIGKGYTRFSGRTPEELRHAILEGRTVAWSRPYSVGDLAAYLRFWLGVSLERGQPAW